MVRMAPNLRWARPDGKCCGKVPPVDVIHLHHGVWLSNGTAGEGEGDGYGDAFYPFMASGEEKTVYQFPEGFGYPVGGTDLWVLNYMIHNLTPRAAQVYITYDIDFVPATAPAAAHITPVHPIWMDVEDHHLYPVFNVYRHSGKDGRFTFPDMAKHPLDYVTGQPPLDEFTIDHPGVLVSTAGHLHPGGLYDTLDLIRPGAALERGRHPRQRRPFGAAVSLLRPLLGQAGTDLLGHVDDRHPGELAPGRQGRRRAADQHHLQQLAGLLV